MAFTSANAVTRLLAVLGERAVPSSTRWAAVGSGTARALEEAGRPVDLVPDVSVAEALAASFPDGVGRADGSCSPGPRSCGGHWCAGLEAKGWVVDEVVAYRTVAGDPSTEAAGGGSQGRRRGLHLVVHGGTGDSR